MKKIFIMMAILSMSINFVLAQDDNILYTQQASRLKKSQGDDSGLGYENYGRVLFSFGSLIAKSEAGESDSPDKGGRFGFMAGTSLSPKVPLYFGIGLDGTYVTQRNDGIKESFLSFAVPIQFSVRIGNPDVSVEPFIGIHGKFNALGRLSDTDDRSKYINYFDEDDMGDDYVFNRAQVGFQLGAGINMGALYLGYELRKDLTALQSETDLKCTCHLFTLGINF